MSESFSSDERSSSVECINGKEKGMSSGRSTPSFRKKPKRPDIKISDHLIYRDFVEIRRTDSLTSIDSEMDRYSFISDGSYIDIPYLSEASLDDRNGDHLTNLHEFEETLRDDTPIPLNSVDVKYNNVKKICRQRPDSPTSLFLLPVFMSNTNDPIMDLHQRLSPLLNRLKQLEEESKLISSLKSKVAILQEEKLKLLTCLNKQKSDSVCKSSSSCDKGTLTIINTSSPCDKEELSDIINIVDILSCDKGTLTNINTSSPCDKEELSDIINIVDILSCDKGTLTNINTSSPCDKEELSDIINIVDILSCDKGTLTNINTSSPCDKEELSDIINIVDILSCDKGTLTDVNNFPTQLCTIETQTSIDSLHSPELFQEIGIQSSPQTKHIGVQKYLEFITEIHHKATTTDEVVLKSTGVGDNIADLTMDDRFTQCSVEHKEFSCQNNILLSIVDKVTETPKTSFVDKSIGDGIAEVNFKSIGMQESPIQVNSSTQCVKTLPKNIGTMFGSPTSYLTDCGIGDKIAEIISDDQNTQTNVIENKNESTQMTVEVCDKSISHGCPLNDMKSIYVQHVPSINDFMCGDNIAEVLSSDKATSNVPTLNDINVGTERVEMIDTSVTCKIINKTKSQGVGDNTINDVICEKCLIPKRSVEVGMYENSEFCCVDDKLCNCVKPIINSIGVGDISIEKINCDKCENVTLVSVAVGDCKIDNLLCDNCVHKKDENNLISIGVGDLDVNETNCEICKSNGVTDSGFNFDLNILNAPVTQQHAVLCHYCGNKVDLNDTQLDESLQAMRDNMKSISCGMKRSTASKNLNVEFDPPEVRTQPSDDDMAVVSDDDYDEENSRYYSS